MNPLPRSKSLTKPSTNRSVIVGAAGVLLCLLLLVITPTTGFPLDWRGVFNGTSPTDSTIFWQTRLPRVLLAVVAGWALAISGVAFQAVFRNPLAEPYILGVSAGAAFGRAMATLFLPASWYLLPWFAPLVCFASAAIPLLALYAWFSRSARWEPTRILLAGAIINVILGAVLMLLQALAPAGAGRHIALWWMGSLDIVGYRDLVPAAILVIIATGWLLRQGKNLNLLTLDPVSAAHLGLNTTKTARWNLLNGTLLASSVVAVAGPVGFVGLVIPHALRLVNSGDNRTLLWLSGVWGAAFLLACDLLAWRGPAALGSLLKFPFEQTQLPVGVVTALLGGPVFLVLLIRRAR